MGNWSPIRDFEDEMMDMQPEYDMIYEKVENGNSLWNGSDLLREQFNSNNTSGSEKLPYELPNLKTDAKIRELAMKSNKIGRQFDENDSDNEYTKETEIISMIRNCGLESDLNEHLDSKKTLPTIHSNKKYQVNGGNGKFIVFLDEEYFKLRPKKKSSKSNSNSEKSVEKDGEKPGKETETAATTTITTNTISSKIAIKNHESATSLLNYYEKMKFYSPKEIYYKKRGFIDAKNESTITSATETAQSSTSISPSLLSFSHSPSSSSSS